LPTKQKIGYISPGQQECIVAIDKAQAILRLAYCVEFFCNFFNDGAAVFYSTTAEKLTAS